MNKKKISLIQILLIQLYFGVLLPQSLVQDAGSWNKLRMKGTIPHTKRFAWWIEPNLRLVFNKNVFLESTNRVALGYHFGENKTIWQGYTINPFQESQGRFGLEHRVWQELYLGFYPTPLLHIGSRTRLEERWINLVSGISLRPRQRILLKFKHRKLEPVCPVIFEEIFLNLTHPRWVSKSLLNQNRAFIGVDYYFSKHNFFRFGYTNRYTTSPIFADSMLHILWFEVHLNFK